ncbi:hypothetical protein SCP_0607500 [Sparassis crispa]|uniref:VPS28 C-terminal domain-containing protein n=1 Tax=Sparassis crispa TaxID=139825 RepID=A0A401GRJ2_9APHY|nr:hypothetical protein SCP_0607500 [Sparassis crispa]GBE84770.1 hypothetical protein SCP_0607500 [Sparassis crispa]
MGDIRRSTSASSLQLVEAMRDCRLGGLEQRLEAVLLKNLLRVTSLADSGTMPLRKLRALSPPKMNSEDRLALDHSSVALGYQASVRLEEAAVDQLSPLL